MQYACEHLNSAHRPRDVWFVKELPRTGSGKIQDPSKLTLEGLLARYRVDLFLE